MQWTSDRTARTDRTATNKLNSFAEEYITLLANKVLMLCEHHFIAKAQPGYLRFKNLKIKSSTRWSNHFIRFYRELFVCYTGCCSCFPPVKIARLCCIHLLFIIKVQTIFMNLLSICVVPDHWTHNQSAFHAFLASALCFFKTKLPFLTKVVYFSDGAASQYKNYKALIFVSINKTSI